MYVIHTYIIIDHNIDIHTLECNADSYHIFQGHRTERKQIEREGEVRDREETERESREEKADRVESAEKADGADKADRAHKADRAERADRQLQFIQDPSKPPEIPYMNYTV